MDKQGIYNQVRRAKTSNVEMASLIQRFDPLIQKLSRQLEPSTHNREDAKQEFYVALIEIISQCPIDNFPDQGDIYVLSYIAKSLRHKYQQLSEAKAKRQTIDLENEDCIPEESFSHQIEAHLQLRDWLEHLTLQQRRIIIAYYKFDYSDAEIGKHLHISRQAVYKARIRALGTLQKLANQESP